jgi:hypothetical protein
MLAFSPLASAPLGADAARLPEVIAQGASAVALRGAAAARAQIGVQSADLTAGLSLGGDARAKPAVSGQSAAGLEVTGSAKALTKQAARLNANVRLAGNGNAEARTGAAVRDGIDLIASVKSSVGGAGSANLLLEFQRFSEAEGQIDVTAARSLPLIGNATARLAGAATTAGSFATAGMARGAAGVVPQAIGHIGLGGAAQTAGLSASTAAGQMALAGQGAMANRASAGAVAVLSIAGQSRASLGTLGQAEAFVPYAGLGSSAIVAEGNGALSFIPDLYAQAITSLSAAAGGGVSLAGQADLEVSVAAQAQPSQLVLAGNAAGTSLEPLEARAFGSLHLNGEGDAVGTLKAWGDGAVAMLGTSATTGMVRAAAAGRLGLARALEAELFVAGAVGRVIALAGAAQATVQASALAHDQRIAFEVEAGARSDAVASSEIDLAAGVECAASGAVTAVGQLGLDAQVQVFAAVGAEGALALALDLRGTAACVADQRLRAEAAVALQILASGLGAAIGIAVAGHDLAGGAEGATANSVAGQGGFAVTRAFAGDVDVLSDSARLIGLGGVASAQTGSTGKTSESVVGLAGSAATRVTAQGQFAAGMALASGAQTSVAAAATSSGLIDWTTAASMTAPRSAQSQGALSLAGAGMAQSAAMGTATAAALAIDCALAGATGLAGDLRSDLPFEGTTGAMLDATARAAGQFDVARSSAADVQIGADAGRGMPLLGAAGGTAHVQAAGSIGAAQLEIMTKAEALTTAGAASGSVFTAQGKVTGQGFLNAASQGNVSVTRFGRGDLLVAGSAARAMVFLGAAEARAITQAAANLPLEPEFAGAGTTVIRVAFQEQEAITGRGTALSMVQAATSGSEWGLGAAALAFRAPPALRRSEPPRMGLSGRLVPTNAGRILKG